MEDIVRADGCCQPISDKETSVPTRQCSTQPIRTLIKLLFSWKFFWLNLVYLEVPFLRLCSVAFLITLWYLQMVSYFFFLWRPGIKIQTVRCETVLPRHRMCQIAVDVGRSHSVSKGAEHSASAPSILYSQNNLNVVSQPCAILRSAQTAFFFFWKWRSAQLCIRGGCGGDVPSPPSAKLRAFRSCSRSKAKYSN